MHLIKVECISQGCLYICVLVVRVARVRFHLDSYNVSAPMLRAQSIAAILSSPALLTAQHEVHFLYRCSCFVCSCKTGMPFLPCTQLPLDPRPRPRLHFAVHSAQRLFFHSLVRITSPPLLVLVLVLIALFRPAIFTDLNVGSAVPGVETGWEGKRFLASPSQCMCSA